MTSIDTIIENMQLIDDPFDRYEYIIELGKKLLPFPKEKIIDSNRVHGCTSALWMSINISTNGDCNPRIILELFSDSQIICGLLYIVQCTYSNKTIGEVRNIDFLKIFNKLQLNEYLSQKRNNGVHILVDRIQKLAEKSII
ncbi:MAG: SufE family protein [Candidatus Liberibacter ctenarytainae]|uniref:SufE family protein n=1 Tax=Candidatus Liberibacter ctenarytainae TaxID=2020335 RepID=A0A937ASR4_9HYPH|nr:SufE family protein [Candidatus Liberibacter ctenarytainae]